MKLTEVQKVLISRHHAARIGAARKARIDRETVTGRAAARREKAHA